MKVEGFWRFGIGNHSRDPWLSRCYHPEVHCCWVLLDHSPQHGFVGIQWVKSVLEKNKINHKMGSKDIIRYLLEINFRI